MRFQRAVEGTPSICAHYKVGLRAVENVDRPRLRSSQARRLAGSVNLDRALAPRYPDAPRWDYAIGLVRTPSDDTVVWVEVHPASSRHVDEVLRKLRWLQGWLDNDGASLRRLPGSFHWVATGTVSFRQGSPQGKRIAQQGLRFPTKQLDLDKCTGH